MVQIESIDGKVVNRSANLRGLRSHAGKHAVSAIYVKTYTTGQATVEFRFYNGDKCIMDWASYIVLMESLRRWRSVYGAALFVDGVNVGEVSFNDAHINSIARF